MDRFVLMFACGALVYQFADKLPISWPLIAVAYAVVLGASVLPDYRLVAAPFLAYALIGTGALIKTPRLRLKNDISYGVYIYAFPIQQLLAATAAVTLPALVFGLIAAALTIPLAALSWFLIEKPASSLKDFTFRRHAVAPPFTSESR